MAIWWKKMQRWWRKNFRTPTTTEEIIAIYKAWPKDQEWLAFRHFFLWQRLNLWLWLALVCLLTFALRNIYDFFFPLQELAKLPPAIRTQGLGINFALLLIILICFTLHKNQFGRRHPGWLFLGSSWSISLSSQLFATLKGFALPDTLGWSLLFLSQATFMPVRWHLHLLSQVGVLLYYFGINTALNLNTGLPNHPEIYNVTFILYIFWFCTICDIGVYLYDRLQCSEFKARLQLESTNQQLKLFIHAVSHDMRNPVLGTTMVLNNLLAQQENKILLPRSILARMKQSSDRQLNLINSLMEAHLSEVQGVALQLQPLELHHIVEGAIADLEPILADNQTILTNLVNAELPLINGDPTQLWRVFSNLIVNAIKHNPPGLLLQIDATLKTNHIYCTISDNGIGINSQQSQRIFDLYYRGGNLHKASMSLGLGLYLCKQIINAHGGEIGVNNMIESGATFWFTLPIHRY